MLSRAKLAAYGLPGLPLAVVTLPVFIYIPTFYAVELGLGFIEVGIVLFLMRLWDVVTDPVIGVLSDRTASKYGRRKVWIVVGVPVVALSAWLLLSPGNETSLWHLTLTSAGLYLGWTMIMLPYTAWGSELSDDYQERSRVTASREGFVLIGTLVALGIPAATGLEDMASGLESLALFFVVMLPLCVLIAAWVLPDAQYRPARTRPSSLAMNWKEIVSNRPFLRLLAAWFLNGLANGLPATLFLIFVETRIGGTDKSGLLLLTYFLSAIAGLPVWQFIARRFGKHRTWCGAMIWACIWFSITPFLQFGDIEVYTAVCIATGLALGADLALPPSIQADVIDLDKADNGKDRAGAFFALWGMATKIALAAAVGIAFPILGLSAFGSAETETVENGMTLALLYGALPIPLKLAAVSLVWRHPIDEAAQADLRRRIGKRQSAG